MHVTTLVIFAGLGAASFATASPHRTLHAPRAARPFELVAAPPDARGISFARLLLPASGAIGVPAQSRVIYLNRTGVTLRPGIDDARANTSSIINQPVTVPAWTTSAQTWTDTVACFRELWSRFDVMVTDVDPGNVPHMEAVFGGSPQNIGMPSGVGGVSPFTEDCAVIENSVVFTFTNVFPNNARVVCEVMAQEVAHSYGLDHEMLASDPMTYLTFTGNRAFADQTVACGEYSNRPCGIGGSVCRANQNSVALLKASAGIADRVAPMLGITSPAPDATVPVGFEVAATATDDVGVTMATLLLDGEPAGTITGAGPFAFPTPTTLADGPHAITVEVTDGKNVQRQTIDVTVGVDEGVGEGSGSGNGSGDGDGEGSGATSGDIVGGCASSGGAGLAIGLVGLGLAFARRRRGHR